MAGPKKPASKWDTTGNHKVDATWRFAGSLIMLYIAWDVRGPGNVAWDDDAWWPLFATIALLFGLAGVRSLALWVRERQVATRGRGRREHRPLARSRRRDVGRGVSGCPRHAPSRKARVSSDEWIRGAHHGAGPGIATGGGPCDRHSLSTQYSRNQPSQPTLHPDPDLRIHR